MAYTTNLQPNPSFEVDLTGYQALSSTIARSLINNAYGKQGLDVVTDGSAAGQGFLMLDVPALPGSYSVSLSLLGVNGTSTLTILTATNPGGVVAATTTVQLDTTWNRYKLEDITVPDGATSIYMVVSTNSAQQVEFAVDGVQVEANATATNYCDGDQYGCTWSGTPHASISTRAVQFALIATGAALSDGDLDVYIPGPVPVALAASAAFGGSLNLTVVVPVATFDDFAIGQPGDPDPAMCWIGMNNSGTASGAQGQPWTRNYAAFAAPNDYPVSDGFAWRRAAYAAVGFKFTGLAAGAKQYLDGIQMEIAPVSQSTPSAFVTPRQIRTVVKPNRMNHATNPGFESSTNGWSVSGNCSITQDTSTFKFGTKSGKITVNSADPATLVSHPMNSLIAGRTYTVSLYIQRDSAMTDVRVGMAGGRMLATTPTVSTLLFGSGGQYVPYGADGYGADPYGGVLSQNTTPEKWVRVYFSFVAVSANDTLQLLPQYGSTPGSFWIDGVLIEETELVNDYFDGSYGDDYLWETGGVPGECRSYYYQGRRAKTYLLNDMVMENSPVGITTAVPVYAVPYMQ